jgi:hypothetical protein
MCIPPNKDRFDSKVMITSKSIGVSAVKEDALFSVVEMGRYVDLLNVDREMDQPVPLLDGEDDDEMHSDFVGGTDFASSIQGHSAATVSIVSGDERDERDVNSIVPWRSGRARTSSHSMPRRSRGKQCLTTNKGFKRHFAVHNYHDYSQETPSAADFAPQKGGRSGKNGIYSTFPVLLHRLMEDAEPKGFSNIVNWQNHGRAFLIHDSSAFVELVLPSYFKHSKLSSFQRQLSLYGFARLTGDGDDRGAYYHECFLRHRPFLCTKIQRTRVKGTWVRTSSSPELEPKFHLMGPVRPLSNLTPSLSLSTLGDSESGTRETLPEQMTFDRVRTLEEPRSLSGVAPTMPIVAPSNQATKFSAPLSPPPDLPKAMMTNETMEPSHVHFDQASTCGSHFLGNAIPDLESFLADIDLDIDFDADVIFPL